MFSWRRKFDIERLKREISILDILKYYGFRSLRKSGNEYVGSCPLHGGDNPTGFHVNTQKNLWRCFTRCGGGSVIDLVMIKEDVGMVEALKLLEKLKKVVGSRSVEVSKGTAEKKVIQEVVHEVLNIDPLHYSIKDRGISFELAEEFGMGYCSTGYFQGRIVIPLHDNKGKLLGYIGRSVNVQDPKYLLIRGFPLGKVVFNYHRVKTKDRVVVVEGVFDALRVHLANYPVVALLGSQITDFQAALLREFDSLIYLFDGDVSGRKAIENVYARTDLPDGKVMELPDGQDPWDLPTKYIKELLDKVSKGESFLF